MTIDANDIARAHGAVGVRHAWDAADVDVPTFAKPKAESWQTHVFTAAALRTMPFPPVSYVVPGLIPEGLTILAGRPKIGKSWLVLDLAIGTATGQNVLGGIKVVEGDVLYCALEDNPRRLQRRITKLLSPLGGDWPERLTLATRWRRLDEGGVEDIEAWCATVQNPRLGAARHAGWRTSIKKRNRHSL
jgi:AAA domain